MIMPIARRAPRLINSGTSLINNACPQHHWHSASRNAQRKHQSLGGEYLRSTAEPKGLPFRQVPERKSILLQFLYVSFDAISSSYSFGTASVRQAQVDALLSGSFAPGRRREPARRRHPGHPPLLFVACGWMLCGP